MTEYILALDQGTSSSRAIVYTTQGEVVARAQQDFEMSFPSDGWVEQNPEVLWETTLQSARRALVAGDISAQNVKALGITNQRETTLVWDRMTGECLYNAIVWQDRRTAQRCNEMAANHSQLDGLSLTIAELIAAQTGLLIDPYFSSTKLAWILENVAGAADRARAGELCFGTVDTFLIWRLTGGTKHLTDATNASRTQLFDIHQQRWCPELLNYYDIDPSLLPEVKDCAGDFGVTTENLLGAAIPITGVAGDQQAALVGQACFEPGQAKSTYGTGCFVISNTGSEPVRSAQQLLSTVAYRLGGEVTYGLEGSIFVAGAAIKWLRDQLGLIRDTQDTSDAFQATGGDTGGVFVVSAFTGLGAPHWQPDARGLITGLTLDTSREQIVTAFLQAVVFQTEELLQAMSKDGATISRLRVDGGMAVNDELCQFLADLLDVVVERPKDVETTARGAAILAALGAGIFPDINQAAVMWACEKEFVPTMADADRARLVRGYSRAVASAVQG